MPGKLMNFDLPKGQSSIIKVIGVGGGGSNAVNHMFNEGIKGVDFVVCNTDSQDLDKSPVPHKIQLGASLTEGLGAGGDPTVGKNSALENIEQIKEFLESNTQMVFVTAGMGGGTGTGGAPVIANIAKEMGILTVGIVTIPFTNEGPKRRQQAEEGLKRMREEVDALVIICNDKLREMYGNLALSTAFLQADNVLATAAKGIAEMISVHGMINVDFRDVSTVMKDSGVAIMGSAVAEGDNRAVKAVELALASPLLNDNKITGARYVLLNITTGKEEPLLDEITDISDYVQQEAGNIANVIMGVGSDESLEDALSVTIIAAGFETNPDLGFIASNQPERVVRNLNDPGQPTIVHQLDEAEGEATEEAPPAEEEKPVFPPIVQAKPATEDNVIENTPERKVYELKMDDDDEVSDVKPEAEVEDEMKLVVKGKTAAEVTDDKVEETEVSSEAEVKDEAEEVTEENEDENENENDDEEVTANEETPKAPASFWDQPKGDDNPKAKEEKPAKDKPVDDAESKKEEPEQELDEAAARKKAELDAILNKFPTPPEKDKPKSEEDQTPEGEEKEKTLAKEDTSPDKKLEEPALEEQEVVGKADVPKDESEEDPSEEPEPADMPEFKLMGNTDADQGKDKNEFEIELNPDTSSSLSNTGTPLSEIGDDDSDPLSSSSLGGDETLSSYSSPNAMDQDERISKLKELSYKLRTPSGVSDLEKQPAYMRRNVDLDDVPHSSKSEVSRFTLNDSEEGEDKIELKPDNPFLHDNVD